MRRIALLCAIALSVGTTGVGPVAPAEAHVDACAGLGSLGVFGALSGLVLPPIDLAPRTKLFTMGTNTLGACAAAPRLYATGVVTGWCGLWGGTGVTDDGHAFQMIAVGTVLVLTGEVDGAFLVVPSNNLNQTCLSDPGVTEFLLGGVADKRHCTVPATALGVEEPVTVTVQGVPLGVTVCAVV